MLAWFATSLSGLVLALPGAAGEHVRFWDVADRLTARLDATWDGDRGYYLLGYGGVETTGNANLLLVHSVAALSDHRGPARQDVRARALVDSLLASPPYVTTPSTRGQPHAPGWVIRMDSRRSYQHMAADSEVVDGLAFAWLAQRELALSPRTKALLRSRVSAVARSDFWRWPGGPLNQINWPARMYTALATVSGDTGLVRRDLRLRIEHLIANARGRAGRAGNFGPGLRFHYAPTRSVRHRLNVDSAEYGSIVASFVRFYAQARRAGMSPPSAAAQRLLRAWLRRVLAGYWTHGGYLNWDTGYGFRRWHQTHKFGFAQQALIGIAATPQLASSDTRSWATWMLRRALAFYERQGRGVEDGLGPNALFGIRFHLETPGYGALASARVAGNAARAIAADLGHIAPSRPPPLYAFDPGTGRLAVTTPAYNTAVVPVSQGAFPYGGIELARLYDGDQEVAANIGGRPPASFGLLVRDRQGQRVLTTQTPTTTLPVGRAPLRLTKAPAGVGVSPRTPARTAYAGPFRDLRAVGDRRTRLLGARVRHRFTPAFVESRWSLRRRAGPRRYTVDTLFPSYGSGAKVTAVRRDGSRPDVGDARIAMNTIAYIHVQSSRSGYVVVPRPTRRAATARTIAVRKWQPSAPNAGPTLTIELAHRRLFDRVSLSTRIAPVPRHADPAAIADRLAW